MTLILAVNNLNLSFEDKTGRRKILDNVSFSVEEGQIVGIVGLSGAGKTSLLRTLNLLQPVDSGEIHFDGKNIVSLREDEIRKMRKKIGVVFQSFNLFRNRTVLQNIAFPLKIQGMDSKSVKKKVLEIAGELGLNHRLRAYPSQLSGGEQQRAAIARALVMDPRMILLDEPTSALDPKTTGRILDLVVELNRRHSMTFIVVTHDMDVIKKTCDKVAYLENGKLEFYGPAHEFFVKIEKNEVRDFGTPLEINGRLAGKEGKLLRVLFWGNRTHEPVMWKVSKELDVSINILYGKIEELKHGPFGAMIISVEGKQQEMFIERLRNSVYSLEEVV
jgi:D-methionine transport system ATP-binding protein